MKFSLFALPLLSVFAVAAPTVGDASLAKRETTIQGLLTSLTAEVKQYTGSMNQTLAALPQHPSADQKKTAADSVAKDINSITSAIHDVNAQVKSAQSSKRSPQTLGDLPSAVLGQLNGQPIVVAKLLLPLIQELNPALESVLSTLSLGEVYLALQPLLTTELPGLVTGLGTLVNGLLVALAPLLSGLGGLLGPLLLGLGL